jgi:hypothetical protein
MMERRREYKDEQDEKGFKPVNKTRRSSFMSYTVLIGLEIILVGIVLFLWAQDVLTDKETLAYFLLGLGGIFFIDTIMRYARLGPRTFMWCRITISLVLLSAGGAVLGGIGTWWPLIIILIGAAFLLNAFLTIMRNR